MVREIVLEVGVRFGWHVVGNDGVVGRVWMLRGYEKGVLLIGGVHGDRGTGSVIVWSLRVYE